MLPLAACNAANLDPAGDALVLSPLASVDMNRESSFDDEASVFAIH